MAKRLMASQPQLQSVQEFENEFLAIFPHRYDYIFAPHPNPGVKPGWQTETRHPLSDRAIQQSSYLYGVRFGSETRYVMLDIDTGSQYHPRRDPLAIDRIFSALEALGLVSYLTVQSSHSGGLHLYFPFEQAQISWKLALAISTLLENAGFKIYPGQLEIFPNSKPYITEGKSSLFAAHRLPLQMGSYLLDRDYQQIAYSQTRFVEQWQYCVERNDLDKKQLDRLIKQLQRRCFKLSGKADKFLNDLNAEIELGWTGYGQTNRLLGRIAMRTYVFHHILKGGEPLSGDKLIQEIVRVAKELPGYQDFCQHQHEILHRAEEWAKCVEESHYFHYGSKATKSQSTPIQTEESKVSWNQQRSQDTRDRIKDAIVDLLNQSKLPALATDRFRILLTYNIGGGSLYRHKDLWHPEFLNQSNPDLQPSENPDQKWHTTTNLLEALDGNHISSNTSSDLISVNSLQLDGNALLDGHPLAEIVPQRTIETIPDSPDVSPSIDCSDVLALISIHIERIGWPKPQIKDCLVAMFGKPFQVQLSPPELADWLTFLEVQP